MRASTVLDKCEASLQTSRDCLSEASEILKVSPTRYDQFNSEKEFATGLLTSGKSTLSDLTLERILIEACEQIAGDEGIQVRLKTRQERHGAVPFRNQWLIHVRRKRPDGPGYARVTGFSLQYYGPRCELYSEGEDIPAGTDFRTGDVINYVHKLRGWIQVIKNRVAVGNDDEARERNTAGATLRLPTSTA
ncbi:MAG TPA: hypothetical protein VFD58_00385 [Blastocatellia bacterium]|nr:hypothetical protein [Blastocatellia bacterium]